jgi:hypothetical protein
MYRKKILSMAAAAAIVTTGAIAFDTTQDGELLTPGSSNLGLYDHNTAGPLNNNLKIDDRLGRIMDKGAGQLGDALIFPAFFGGSEDGENEWKSEFSVINTSEHAIVAKVVLYGSIDSVELRDFNIYLSAHDVFRATLKNGKIYSEDGSTVLPTSAETTEENLKDYVYNTDSNLTSLYKYNDTCEMVSKDKPLDMYIDPAEATGETGHGLDANGNPAYEHNGYIAVFAMAEAANESYHNKHKELWQDYRHLVDTCRSVNHISDRNYDREWREGITRGLYNDVNISTPNRLSLVRRTIDKDGIEVRDYYRDNCKYVYPSVLGETKPVTKNDENRRKLVEFKSPGDVLTGSILVSNPGIKDNKGHRDLLIEAYALGNVTDDNIEYIEKNDNIADNHYGRDVERPENDKTGQILLWSEGEFAHLADRCIDRESLTEKDEDGNKTIRYFAGYNEECIKEDAEILNKDYTYYEFRDNTESALVVTQPYKRVLLQRIKPKDGRILAWNNLTVRNEEANGQFRLKMEIYNDDELHFTPTLGAFIVSPATTSRTSGIPNEVSIFNPFTAMSHKDKERLKADEYLQGYSVIRYKNGTYTGISAIISQMAATIDETGKAETNWIYPLSDED